MIQDTTLAFQYFYLIIIAQPTSVGETSIFGSISQLVCSFRSHYLPYIQYIQETSTVRRSHFSTVGSMVVSFDFFFFFFFFFFFLTHTLLHINLYEITNIQIQDNTLTYIYLNVGHPALVGRIPIFGSVSQLVCPLVSHYLPHKILKKLLMFAPQFITLFLHPKRIKPDLKYQFFYLSFFKTFIYMPQLQSKMKNNRIDSVHFAQKGQCLLG